MYLRAGCVRCTWSWATYLAASTVSPPGFVCSFNNPSLCLIMMNCVFSLAPSFPVPPIRSMSRILNIAGVPLKLICGWVITWAQDPCSPCVLCMHPGWRTISWLLRKEKWENRILNWEYLKAHWYHLNLERRKHAQWVKWLAQSTRLLSLAFSS